MSTMLRTTAARVLGALALCLLGLIGAVGAAHVVVAARVDRALAEARRPPAAFEIRFLPPRSGREAPVERLWTSTLGVTDGAAWSGRIVVATGGGLVEIVAARARRLRTAGTDPGFADHTLTAVAALGARLVLGARSGTLSLLEGNHLRSLRLGDGRLGTITDLLWHDEDLLVATASGRVIRLTGDLGTGQVLGPPIEGGATAIAPSPDGPLVAGADGVLRRVDGDRLEVIARPADGDPSVRLTAVVQWGDRLFVGTPTGLLGVDGSGRFVPHRRGLFVTTLIVVGERLLVGTHDRGVLVLDVRHPAGMPTARALPGRRVDRLRLVDARPMAFGPGLVASLDVMTGANDDVALPAGLASNHITALALDDRRQLWVGTFDDGVDVLGTTGEVVRHLPTPEMSRYASVNALAVDRVAGSMLVATSHGVLEVLGDAIDVIDQDDGLIGEAVTALLVRDETRVFATNRGLSLATGRGGEVRSIYAFHGLPSNRLYALAAQGDRLWVGTLGGTAVIEGLRVQRSLRAATGQLRAAWCTALAVAPEGTYVGTTAGGLDLVHPDGTVEPFSPPEVERFSVNQGAMLLSDHFLLVGTLERGLLIFDRNRTEWVQFDQPLPGAAVTALAAAEDALWVGTDRGLLRLGREIIGDPQP